MIDISIIIVNWNTRELLCKTLQSIGRQQGEIPVEIIVVDNSSSDGSQTMIRDNFPDVRLICNEENLGFAKANNIGILQSSGRYLCLINSDIELTDTTLDTLLNIMDSNPEIGIAGPRILNPNRTVRQTCRRYPTVQSALAQAVWLDRIIPRFRSHLSFSEHEKTGVVDVLAGCFWFVRREALEEVGMLDEVFFIYSEDVDWCRRFSEHGWEVVYLHEAESIHLGKGSSSQAPIRFFIEMQKSFIQYWAKHHGFYSAIVMREIMMLKYFLRICLWSVLYVIPLRGKKHARFMLDRYLKTVKWMRSARIQLMN